MVLSSYRMSMNQGSFDGFARPHPTDRLFFAVVPPPAVAERMAALAADLRGQLGLRGRPRPTGHLHVTLHHLGDFVGLPQRLVDEACTAAAGVAWPSFETRFDRAASFRGRPGKHPFVLLGAEGEAGLTGLYQSLGTQLAAAGLARRERAFVPHITLLYDARTVAPQPIPPLGWTGAEFLLIHSLLGRTEYHVLGRWSLAGSA